MLAALMIITVLVFYPALNSDFINLDDRVMITNNPKVRSLSAENVKSLLLEPHIKLYHPLVNLSYAVEYKFFGADPYPYHLNNIFLHLFNTLFVFFIFFRLTNKNFIISFITALIFACHPMHVEPVAWASGRKDTLYAFFFLAAWLTYLKAYSYEGRKHACFIFFSMVLFLFACLSKSMAVTFPAVLILSDWLQGRGFNKKSILKYIPFIIAAAVFSLSTYILYYTPDDKQEFTLYALFVNFVSAHFNILFYMTKFLFPVKLSVIYPHFFDVNSIVPSYILRSPALLYGIIILIVYSLKKTKTVFWGFAFFVMTALPVLNILPAGISPAADRYTYIPLIGFGYIAASGAAFLYGMIKKEYIRAAFMASLSALMIIMCMTAQTKAEKWHNEKTLFDDVIKNYPGELSKAYEIRGVFYRESGMNAQAEKDFAMALFLDKESYLAIYSLAGSLREKGEYDKALEMYAALPEYDVNISKARAFSANIYYDYKKDAETAHKIIDKALKSFPDDFLLNITLGTFYSNEKKYDQAIQYFQKAKKIYPDNSRPYIYLADVYKQTGREDLMRLEYAQGIRKCINDGLLFEKFGELYFEAGSYESAEKIFSYAVKIYPDNYKAYDYLGNICAIREDHAKALYYFTLSVLVRNDYAPAYFHRCAVHLENENYAKALEDARRAKELGFKLPEEFQKEIRQKTSIIL
jgi:tetratricopeptide (TPR) repeat protein